MEVEPITVDGHEYWKCHAQWLHVQSGPENGQKSHLHASAYEAEYCSAIHEILHELFSQLHEMTYGPDPIFDSGDLDGIASFFEAIDDLDTTQEIS